MKAHWDIKTGINFDVYSVDFNLNIHQVFSSNSAVLESEEYDQMLFSSILHTFQGKNCIHQHNAANSMRIRNSWV